MQSNVLVPGKKGGSPADPQFQRWSGGLMGTTFDASRGWHVHGVSVTATVTHLTIVSFEKSAIWNDTLVREPSLAS